MISSGFTLVYFLLSFTYAKGITLGAPDTIKILVSPMKVVERGDTIVALDQERDRTVIKNYTLDGFFINMRPYNPSQDSILFEPSWVEPNTEIVKKASTLRFPVYMEHISWKAMFIEPDSMIWMVAFSIAGDAGELVIFMFEPQDTMVRVCGWRSIAGEYQVHSLRRRIVRSHKIPFYFSVGNHYIYIIGGETLCQYDRQARFVRKIGIEPEQSFKEPCGIAIDSHHSIFITDFQLGLIWRYNPRYAPAFRSLFASEEILPKSPTYLCISKMGGVWFSDILHKRVQAIWSGAIVRSFSVKELKVHPGGVNFRIALADSFVLIHELHPYNKRILVYDMVGHHLRTYEGADREGKKDDLIDMDNYGNCYFFKRGKEWSDVEFYGVNPYGVDTFNVVLPDSFQNHRFTWSESYRVGNTLYLLGSYSGVRGFYVFERDSLKYIFDETEFQGGLTKYISDFAVAASGRIWVVDIENRLVQEYCPIK